ncbi:MAG: hypothetical protein ACTSRO_12475, partial [Candidatus Heimdallarchaeaceae archaeon]
LASPHNLRIENYIGIIRSEWCEGSWENEEETKSINLKWKINRDFSTLLYKACLSRNIPVVAVNYGAAEGDVSSMKMDWGTLIPLWFVKKEYEKQRLSPPELVLITPSREIPWENLVELGKKIVELSNKENKNVIFIASADHGHSHDPNGPYGYNKASSEYDDKVCELIRTNNLNEILNFTPQFLEKAKPDSFWQLLILLGIIEKTELKRSRCVYECPTYYGMIVADFEG